MKYRALKLSPVALAASLLLAGQAHAVGNGTIADGTGSISKNGTTTNVNQSSDKLIINWNNMDVAQGETLNFNQKNYNSAVLNRINSANATSILGALNANGRVFIVNPNGVLIGNGAKINVGSLIASSLNISDDDFKTNRLNFKGGGNGNVVNQGEINANESVALIGSKTVQNTGTINSYGNVALAAGDAITLQFANSGLQASVTEGSLQALIHNGGLIATQDGDIALTAWARDAIARTVINNTGTLEASTLNSRGRASANITLASSGNGEVKLGGRIESKYNKGSVFVSGAKLTQSEDSEIFARNASLNAGNNGDITLSGKTIASTTIKGKNVTVDGTLNNGGSLYISAENARTTDRAKINASNAQLRGGKFDFSRGSNKFDRTDLGVDSADIALDGYSYVTGSVKNDLRVRGNDNLQFSNLNVGGKLDASAKDNLTYDTLYVDGDVKLHGKNVTGQRGYGFDDGADIDTQGNIEITADDSVQTGKLNANGYVKVSAGNDVKTTGIVTGKSIDMRAENGILDVYGFKSTEDAYLKGGRSIHVGKRSTAGKNLTMESQGNVVLEDGVVVGGDLEYKLGANSQVANNGQANDVKGKTIGQPGQADGNKPDDKGQGGDNKPDDKGQGGDNKPDDKGQGGDNKPDDKGQGGDNKPDDKGQGGDNKPDDKGQGGNEPDQGITPPEGFQPRSAEMEAGYRAFLRSLDTEALRNRILQLTMSYEDMMAYGGSKNAYQLGLDLVTMKAELARRTATK
ncbi:filamentous hemagglutinin N-terminal domain-containing protein [Trinickia sp. YCB016]